MRMHGHLQQNTQVLPEAQLQDEPDAVSFLRIDPTWPSKAHCKSCCIRRPRALQFSPETDNRAADIVRTRAEALSAQVVAGSIRLSRNAGTFSKRRPSAGRPSPRFDPNHLGVA